MGKFPIVVGACALIVATMAQAADPPSDGMTGQVQRLMACRAIASAEQRLACFDRETAAIDQAIASKDLVFIDKAKAQAAKRSLFGFSIPNFGGLFGGGDDELNEVEGLIDSTSTNQGRGWVIQLQDGSVWTQTDDTVVPLIPKRGEKVTIRRGTLGSFFMKIGRQPGFRAKRIG